MRKPRLLVAIPSITYEQAARLFDEDLFLEPARFPWSDGAMDCFSREMAGASFFGAGWGINVPHLPLERSGLSGVAGPGLPQEEIFHPPRIKGRLESMAGAYDKWRPYPAEPPLSQYNLNIARRFARKRARMLSLVGEEYPWDTLFYVEHSPSSVAHLDEDAALDLAIIPARAATAVLRSWPSAEVVVFSPYGTGRKGGFAISNTLEGKEISNWEAIRNYLAGRKIS